MSKPCVDWSLYFWTHVAVRDGDDCWEWQLSRNPVTGYGQVGAPTIFGRRPQLAHRVAWILTYGAIPEGLHVLHSCDNPPCVRPDHLFLGTALDNAQDKVSKGRHRHGHTYGDDHWTHKHPEKVARGEQHGMSILSLSQVQEIRAQYDNGWKTQQELADQYHVSRPTISTITRGHHWKQEKQQGEGSR